MTTEPNEPDPTQVPDPNVVLEVNAEPDILLRALVGTVNQAKDMEIGLTLHMSGLIVSGTLISYTSYLQALAALLWENGSPESQAGRDALASNFELLIDGDEEETATDPATQQNETSPPSHIHLRAATIHSPGSPGYFPKTLWRGRLSHVSAWTMGSIEPGPAPR